jgi:hypothetical protein
MSLINDALKRAKEAQGKQQQQPSPSTPGEAPFMETEPPPSSSKAPLFAGVVIAFLLVVLVWAYITSPGRNPAAAASDHLRVQESMETLELSSGEPGLAFDTASSRLHQLSAGKDAPPNPAAFMALPGAPAPEAMPSFAEPVPMQQTVRNEELPGTASVVPGRVASEPAMVAVAARDSSEFPAIKLQAIHFRLKRPSVLANGTTLYIGDSVEGAKVVEIQRQSVMLDYGGRTNWIHLRQQ